MISAITARVSRRLSLRFPIGIAAALTALSASISAAQNDGPPPRSERVQVGLPQVNVIDKMLAIEGALAHTLNRYSEEDWAQDYLDLYKTYSKDGTPGNLESKGRPVMAMALGIKASDGILALKGRGVEQLNNCAEQIEKLAGSLGIEKEYLSKAYQVKQHANNKQWLEAFMYLGFLQHEVIRKLNENPERKDEAILVVMGGWLQAGRCVTDTILKNYSGDLSNTMREPKMVELMITELDSLPDDLKQHPSVVKLIALLPQVKEKVDVGLYDPIPKEDVQWLHDNLGALVDEVMAPAVAE